MRIAHPARYIMVSGFLGAGKTTALLRLAEFFAQQHQSVWLITNEHIDTQRLEAAGLPVAEIVKGCFCSRFNELLTLATRLQREHGPDVILAEPVGSYTDLRSTVHYPMRLMYGHAYAIAPLAVLVDATRLEQSWGLTDDPCPASEAVQYIFDTQLAEANILVVNKCDLLDEVRQQTLVSAAQRRYPAARVIPASMHTGYGIEALVAALLEEAPTPPDDAPAVDYARYGDGESSLGWLKAILVAHNHTPFSPEALLQDAAQTMAHVIAAHGGTIAHLKLSLRPHDQPAALTAVSVLSTTGALEWTARYLEAVAAGIVTVNIRGEASPELLQRALRAAIAQTQQADVRVKHIDAFTPHRPKPVYRMVEPVMTKTP